MKQPENKRQGRGSRIDGPIEVPTSVDTSKILSCSRAEVKKRNLETTDRIKDLVQELDRKIAAGERPFGKYLDKIGAYPASPGALFDFEWVWRNRFKWPEAARFRIERFGCLLNWVRQDGKPGYWNKNKDEIPFAQEFAILSHIEDKWVQPLADCGLFIKDFNGNRVDACGDEEGCRKCNWNGRIEPKQRSYAPGTFVKMGNGYGYTLSYETDPAYAWAIGRLITEEDYHVDNPDSVIYQEKFRPPNWNLWGEPGLDRATPDFIRQSSPDIDHPGRRHPVLYASRRFLGACQHAIGSLVHGRWLDGAEQNCEVALGFMPFRVRWHVHGIACSKVHDDPQAIADRIKEEVDARLAQLYDECPGEEWPLNQRLYANVMVVKFVEHQELLDWIEYIFKTINYWEPLYEVYLRPENLLSDGRLHPSVDRLLREEVQHMREWIDGAFSTKSLTMRNQDGTRRLNRSYLWGCLRFGDGDEFIRFETKQERKCRHRRAEQQRRRRQAKRGKAERARLLAEREGL